MTAAEVTWSASWLARVTDAPLPSADPDHVQVPVAQWDGTVATLALVCAAAGAPSVYLSWSSDRGAELKADVVDGVATLGRGLDAGLDGVRGGAGDLSSPSGVEALYRAATCARLVWCARAIAGAPGASGASAARGTSGIALLVAGTVVVVAGLAALAWYRSTVETETLRVKASEQAVTVAVAQAGRDGMARVAEHRATGRMPPPTPLEIAVADVVREQARQHDEGAASGYVARALSTLRGGVADAASGTRDVLYAAAALAFLYALTKGSSR